MNVRQMLSLRSTLSMMSSDQPHDIGISDSVDIFDLIYTGYKRHIHKPLQTSDSIRVLELLPGNSGSMLSCRIHEIHRTDSDVDFEALSYVWGNPNPAYYLQDIESEIGLRITGSLYQALKALRYPDRSRVLWADAVCIDQSDNNEKSHQVKNMGFIYATARTVVVWLGNEDLGEAFKTLEDHHEKPVEHVMPPLDPDILDSVMIAILRIAGTPWFTRLWIIQEFVLAREVQIWAGSQHIDHKTLEKAIRDRGTESSQLRNALLGDPSLEQLWLPLRRSVNGYSLAENLIDFRTRWHEPSRPGFSELSLYDCCRIVHKDPPQCTDKRDLIYALLGLAKTPTKTVSNYNLSVVSVFLQFTWSEIVNGNIEILRDAEFMGKDDLMPLSFGDDPEATQRRRKEHPSFLYRLPPRSRHAYFVEERKFAGANRAVCAIVTTPASIQIRGVMVDRISECRALINVTTRMAETKRDYENMLENPRVYMNKEDCFEDPTFFTYATSTNLLDVYRSVQTQTSRLIKRGLAPRDVTEETLRERFWRTITQHLWGLEDVPGDFGWVPPREIHDIFLPKFFITTKGYMGKATKEARAGDSVIIFDGSKVPFVTRKAIDDGSIRWKLVGECYANGWMDGSYYGHEVVDDVDQYLAAADAETDTDFSCRKKTLLSEYFVLC